MTEKEVDKVDLFEPLLDKKNGASEFMKTHLIDLTVIAIMIIYIARTIATIGIADKSILEIVADSALAFFFAISISVLMQKKAFLVGETDGKFVATMREFSIAIDKITPYTDKLDAFCEKRNRENLKRSQERVLMRYGISYETFLKGFEAPNERQREALQKVAALKVHELTTQELVSECGASKEEYGIGMTQAEYSRQKNTVHIAMTIVTTVIFGYFTLRLATDFNWAGFVWSMVQVAFFAVKGAMSYASAYVFMRGDYRNRIIRKTELLYEFYNQMTAGNKEGTNG